MNHLFRSRLSLFAGLLFLSFTFATKLAAATNDVEQARSSVVKIETTFFTYSYSEPWKQPILQKAGGTGFIVSGNRIVTNAHVISQSTLIRVQRPGQRKDYEARVIHVAHDCDLAMLEVDDEEFFKGAVPLEIGETPELNSPVTVVGFPIGGDRVSITRGVVSRLDMDTYSHSQIDQHLIVQVDAAINPGNSGGPALQDGKVIGVAFQVLTRGENLGYLIPPPVIKRFLTDIEDSKYDGYIEFGVVDFPTINVTLRQALSLNSLERGDDTGVLVTATIPGSSADGNIMPEDVLLSVNGSRINGSGDVEIQGSMQPYAQLVDNLSAGTPIKVEVLRKGEVLNLEFPARPTAVMAFQRMNYDTPPSYYFVGGLLFQPLDADLMDVYSRAWSGANRVEILYRYNYFISRGIYKEVEQDVVLTRRFGDRVNLFAGPFLHRIVETVNDRPVHSFPEFVSILEDEISLKSYIVFKFRNLTSPLVFKSADLKLSTPAIQEKYGVESTYKYYPRTGEGKKP